MTMHLVNFVSSISLTKHETIDNMETLSKIQKVNAKAWKISCISSGFVAMKKYTLRQSYDDFMRCQQ